MNVEQVLKTLMEDLSRLEKKVDQILNQTARRPPTDDEAVGRNPSEKYWQGENYKGCRLSECPPDFLRAYAKYRSACVFMARKENNPDKMKYVDRDEKSAKLALEWADYRESTGMALSAPAPQAEPDFGPPGADADIPF